MTRIVNFFCFVLLILAAWSISYSLANADTCMTAAELADYATFRGMHAVENGDKLHLSREVPVNPLFVQTIVEIWVRVGEGYCMIEGGKMT